jgi:hypothetical protein
MSAAKILSTIGAPNNNVKRLYPGQQQFSSIYNEERYKKSKEFIIGSHEFVKNLTNFGFGQSGTFNLDPSELFMGNICLKIELDATTAVTLPPCWGYNIIDEIQLNVPGAQKEIMSGKTNFLLTVYECNSDSKRQSALNLGSSNNVTQYVNPGGSIIAYVHLNILCSSMDENQKTLFPIHLLNQNISCQIKFKRATDFVVAGATPTFVNVEALYERFSVYDHEKLKSKQEIVRIPYRLTRDFPYAFTGSTTAVASIRADGLTEDGELNNLFFTSNLDTEISTNKNSLQGDKLTNITVKLGDRNLLSGDFDFQSLLQLWHKKDQMKYQLATEQRYYDCKISNMDYKDQLKYHIYTNGGDFSQEDIKFSFNSPNGASTFNVIAIYKNVMTFHRGLMNNMR